MGGVEEEYAGGALAFASYSLGNEFQVNSRRYNGRSFEDVARDYAAFIDARPDGYGVDRNYLSLIYIPENALVSLSKRCVSWTRSDGTEHQIPLSPDNVYIAPSGYQIRLEKHPAAPLWRLVSELKLKTRLEEASQRLAHVSSPEYLDELVATLGADPMRPIEVAIPASETRQAVEV